ncbi:MAG: putative DNA-binding domain-containing protein [Flavobacteriales bacterium]|nr:putative DNA-binding domain-containing protein [Flavobacteriales bacterium]
MEKAARSLNPETHRIQSQLAEYCKTGKTQEIKGALPDRLHNYRRLVFNVIFDIMTNAYPITRNLFGDRWKEFLQRFFIEHKCQHYQVWKLPEELLIWVKNADISEKTEFPFLTQLLEFEWAEIVVYNGADQEIPKTINHGNWRLDDLVFNPYYYLINLSYPIHKMPLRDAQKEIGNYCVILLRDLKKLNVKVLEFPLFFGTLMGQLNSSKNLHLAALDTCAMLQLELTPEIEDQISKWINQMIEKGFILGYRTTA